MASRNILTLVFISIIAAASWGQGLRFSHNPGIHASGFDLLIEHSDNSAEIWYTTNGSEPEPNSAGSQKYSVPIAITNQSFNVTTNPNALSNIRTTPLTIGSDEYESWSILPWRAPLGNFAMGTVIRAAAFKNGNKSDSLSGSFFVFPQGSPYRELPLVSVIIDRGSLFNHDTGIYVPGKHWNGISSWTGNYYQRGDEWERTGNFEYFDSNESSKAIISQTVGYRIHGGWTRRFPQKTLRIYARREYGKNTLDFENYKVFHNRDDTRFKRLLLRANGNDYEYAFMRDASAQYMVSHNKTFDMQAFRSVVMFINGEFWGVCNIRERLDKHYFARVYGVDSENIDLLDFYGSDYDEPSEGTRDAFNRMTAFARTENLAHPIAMDSMFKMIDIDSYVDHYALQIILGNIDGVYNNHRVWRERRPFNRNASVGRDGRFRWLIFDLDQILEPWGPDSRQPTLNMVFNASEPRNELFLNLMKNESVRHHFANSFANMLNSAFLPGRAEGIIDSIAKTISPVMSLQTGRWGYPGYWESAVTSLRENYRNKILGGGFYSPDPFRNTVRTYFAAGADRSVTLKSDPAHGVIKINSMTVDSKLPGTTAQVYPWSGSYFANIPITVRGVGKPNYRIAKWIVKGDAEGEYHEFRDSVLTVRLSSGAPGISPVCNECTVEAIFEYYEPPVLGAAGRQVSRSNFSISHSIHSRSNVTFNFTLPEAGNVQLRVYNLAGKEVARVANSKFGAGSHQLNWKSGHMASGVYIYRLKVQNKTLDGRLRL